MAEVRGFSKDKGETAWLLKHGLPDKAIYQAGRGAENLDECIASYRGRVGKLLVAHDLRIFGETKKMVAEVMTRLETARIRVVDISHPHDTTIAEMMQRASVAISHSGLDKKTAKKRGRKGGLGKGVGALIARESHVPTDFVDRIMDCTEICWRLKLEILGPQFSASTLRRHYGAAAKARRAA